MAADGKSEQIILRGRPKAAEGRRTPRRWREGGARHSVRAARHALEIISLMGCCILQNLYRHPDFVAQACL
jgi:hypothetical protein